MEVDKTKNIKIFDRIEKKAKEKGISINALEKQAGISIGSTYKWNTVSPTIKNIAKVAEVLDCTIDELINGEKAAGQEKEVV